MIKTITITNYLDESLVLNLMKPELSGFIIIDIDGLGPPKANINTTDVLTMDGSTFNSAHTTSRNIVLNLRFLPNPTIEDTRQKSYKYFPLKKPIRIRIETDNRISFAEGYVESNDPSIFGKNVGCTVSILCPNPALYSENITTTVFSGAESNFEFPFSNESLTESLILFGNVTANSEQTVYYTGDSEIGLLMYIYCTGPVADLSIYNLRTREGMIIDTTKLETLTGSGLNAGDEIIISTVAGQKYIKLVRGGLDINILSVLDKDSTWFKLLYGDNLFAYTAVSGQANLQFRVEHKTVFEGA